MINRRAFLKSIGGVVAGMAGVCLLPKKKEKLGWVLKPMKAEIVNKDFQHVLSLNEDLIPCDPFQTVQWSKLSGDWEDTEPEAGLRAAAVAERVKRQEAEAILDWYWRSWRTLRRSPNQTRKTKA